MSSNLSPQSPASATSIPILAVAILGILATVFLLISYYFFAIKCCFNWRRSDLLLRLISTHSRRHSHFYIPPVIHEPITEVRGLDTAIISSLPIIKFRKTTLSTENKWSTSCVECSVCLSEFEEEEKLKVLPSCLHGFHIDCIDTWLQFNANCPLCRSEVMGSSLLVPDRIVVLAPRQEHSESGSVVIDVGDDAVVSGQSSRTEAVINPSAKKKGRKFQKIGSFGDECLDVRLGVKDEDDKVIPIRRSISMDSCNDRQMYLAIQHMLRQNPPRFQEGRGDGEASSSHASGVVGGSGRIRRSLFSFGRSSRRSVLPI